MTEIEALQSENTILCYKIEFEIFKLWHDYDMYFDDLQNNNINPELSQTVGKFFLLKIFGMSKLLTIDDIKQNTLELLKIEEKLTELKEHVNALPPIPPRIPTRSHP